MDYNTYLMAKESLLFTIKLTPVAFRHRHLHSDGNINIVWINRGWKVPNTRPDLTIDDMVFRLKYGFTITDLRISAPATKYTATSIEYMDAERMLYPAIMFQLVKHVRKQSNFHNRETKSNQSYQTCRRNDSDRFLNLDCRRLPTEINKDIVFINCEDIIDNNFDRISEISEDDVLFNLNRGDDPLFDDCGYNHHLRNYCLRD